ncbi:MAG: hypothetical protein LAO09_10020 [Acidobacteriia bacterium]|nr:hypothetical protein [Terriglobia bacterium]
MTRLGGWKKTCAALLFCVLITTLSSAQTFTTLVSFDGINGYYPQFASLTQGRDGNLYGTTVLGGNGFGTIFRMTPSGDTTLLHTFNFTDGEQPFDGLTLGVDGNFYGTTSDRGINGFYSYGTIFKMTPEGVFTTLYNFSGSDGAMPHAGLTLADDGNFYGTSGEGGGPASCGTFFKITPSGKLTSLHTFLPNEGCGPNTIVQAADGYFYGTAAGGGDSSKGTVFRITKGGVLTRVHSFCGDPPACTDGATPQAGVIFASDGNFYGTATAGGTHNIGTLFKLTSRGTFTVIHTFRLSDGSEPFGLVEAADGMLYGTAIYGGGACSMQYGCGTIFRVNPDGHVDILHAFGDSDGWFPWNELTQSTSGAFYGLTTSGGDSQCNSCGTAFSLNVGVGPFVAFVRASGKVGQIGGILGQGFTGTSSVSINGTPANFTVVSDTFLKATVPAGATTGYVTVTTPSGTLTSNKPFRVTPQLLSFNPPSGPVGAQVTITGVSLTQTQGVGFGDRVPAQFTVNSDTQVIATVPAGAKTGKIGIETKGGVAISSGMFTVTQ